MEVPGNERQGCKGGLFCFVRFFVWVRSGHFLFENPPPLLNTDGLENLKACHGSNFASSLRSKVAIMKPLNKNNLDVFKIGKRT
jgi:hypothetical protein